MKDFNAKQFAADNNMSEEEVDAAEEQVFWEMDLCPDADENAVAEHHFNAVVEARESADGWFAERVKQFS